MILRNLFLLYNDTFLGRTKIHRTKILAIKLKLVYINLYSYKLNK